MFYICGVVFQYNILLIVNILHIKSFLKSQILCYTTLNTFMQWRLMEFKYFSFYKSISNFATNLVGIFLPLLIYEYTELFYLAIVFYVSQYLFTILFSVCLRKCIYSKPQLILLFRIVQCLLCITIFGMPIAKQMNKFVEFFKSPFSAKIISNKST